MVEVVLVSSENFEINDLNSGVSPVPKMPINDCDVVPNGRPDLSSSCSELMSL